MGIQGLLKALSPLILDEENGVKSSNIRQFANKSLAIDASSWLFKGLLPRLQFLHRLLIWHK